MKKRYLLTAVIALLSVMATSAQTLTITTNSGSKQFSASDITSSSPATFTSNGTRMTIGSDAYNVSDIISALVACENQGYVKETCSECGGDTHCTRCHGTGKGCTTCNGTGKYCRSCGTSGKDVNCGGSGRCSTCGGTGKFCSNCNSTGKCGSCNNGKCSTCRGSGKKECSDCRGSGNCWHCKGAGKVGSTKCTSCGGSGVCQRCKGERTENCSTCSGNGNCGSCGGNGKCYSCHGNPTCGVCSGNSICRNCGGSGTCTVCSGKPQCSTCGGDGHCAKCKNSDGKCTKCSGKGYVWADIVLSDNSITLSHQGESKYVTVTINQSWKATCSASWITLKDAEGRNSGKITITADVNTSEDSRSATLVISYGSKSEYVSITQKGVPVNLSISPDDFSIHRNGGEQTLKVTSDTYWTVSTDATWIGLSKYSGDGNGEVVVTAPANEGNARSAIITFTHNKTKVEVKVSQDAKLYVPLEIRNVIIMNTTGGTGSSSIINMEKDGLYASKLVYLSERLIIYYKTAGNYRVTRKWYCPGSTEPDCYSWYDFPSYLSTYDNPFVVEFYNNYWKPEYYKTGTHRWEYYYEDELIYTKTFTVY